MRERDVMSKRERYGVSKQKERVWVRERDREGEC